MYHLSKIFRFLRFLHLFVFLAGSILQIECFNFSYPSFNDQNEGHFTTTGHSRISPNVIQVAGDTIGGSMFNLSGRAWYNNPMKLYSKRKNISASFNSTFNMLIKPLTDPGGEGIAFILTKEKGSVLENSYGHWLGIVNGTTNGSSSNNIVAIEFDTRKSYPEDLDDNHVGVNTNSIHSIEQVSLSELNVNLSSGIAVTASIRYNGEAKVLSIFVFSNETRGNVNDPVLVVPLDLSTYLPEEVFVGFSGSTGEYTEISHITSWDFSIFDINDPPDDEGTRRPSLLWIVIPAAIVAVSLGCLCIYIYQKNKVEWHIEIPTTAPKKFRLKELKRATRNFNTTNVLGKGGSGVVYKGLLDNNEIAVKRFSKDSSQGKETLIAEVTTIDNLHHKNLVRLIGWCYESNELLVVYEFMPNGSLDKILFGKSASVLSWERRLSIISGVADALDYLHNGCDKRILHRDIKPSNVMLDGEFNARLGDFGLARTIQVTGENHYSTTHIAGTLGYMAPEIFHTGRATVETDIYAFGVLTLEVACGKKHWNQVEENKHDNGIIDYVWNLYQNDAIVNAIDINLNENFEKDEAESLLKLGLACCHPNPHERPSIRIVVQVLKGEMVPPLVKSEKPAFIWPAKAPSSGENFDSLRTENQLTVTALIGR